MDQHADSAANDKKQALGVSTARSSIAPRLLRLRDVPAYLGMDRNRFNGEVRPYLTEIPIGMQGIAFDRLELDDWVDDYIQRNGRRPKAVSLEDDKCQNATKCRDYALRGVSGKSKKGANTAKAAGSGKAQAYLNELKRKST